MPDTGFLNLFVVSLVALAAPLVLGFAPRLRVPAVIVEILAGVLLGPSVLGLVEADLTVEVVAVLGLGFLLFLAGLELDPDRLRGRSLQVAGSGYALTLVLGLVVGLVAWTTGRVGDPLFLAVALSATSLGLVVPVLKDAGRAEGTAGQTVIAAASLADLLAVGLLTLLFSTTGGTLGSRVVLLAAFLGVVGLTGVVVTATGRSMRLGGVLDRLQDTTAQIRVRAAVVLMLAFTALAERFGLETILGAFLAGVMVSLLDRDAAGHPQFRVKLEALGYGFLIPVFFVASGLRLDLAGLLASPTALALAPLLLLALLVVRGVPALLYLRALGPRTTAAAALLQATSLPFLVTAAEIGVGSGVMDRVTAAALVTAGVLSVLLFPAAALGLLRGESTDAARQGAEVAVGPPRVRPEEGSPPGS